jgi:Ca2+-binding EF-hand superfamily protein
MFSLTPAERLLSFRFILFPVFFDEANTSMQGQDDTELDKDEFCSFFRELMGDNYSDEAADEAFDAIDVDGSGGITLAEFKEGVLKSNKNKTSGLPSKCITISIAP